MKLTKETDAATPEAAVDEKPEPEQNAVTLEQGTRSADHGSRNRVTAIGGSLFTNSPGSTLASAADRARTGGDVPSRQVYKAFTDADALSRWLPPNGFTARLHLMDVRVGGTFEMSFKNFTTGNSHSFGGEYLELVPGERIRYTDRFDDPNLPGEIMVPGAPG